MGAPVLSHRLTTRGYELASNGKIPMAVMLRYLEHQRWQTFSPDSIIPVRRFWKQGVVRAQQVDSLEPLGLHQEIELRLWVGRVGRTSFDFAQEILDAASDRVVAKSLATVVALDSQRRPLEIAAEARDYVADRPALALDRPTTERPSDAWELPVFIRPSDQDLQQHVNHARYADLFDDLRLLAARDGALGARDFSARVSRLYLQYDGEARVGDDVVGSVWRASDADDALELRLAKRDGTVVTRGRMTVEPW